MTSPYTTAPAVTSWRVPVLAYVPIAAAIGAEAVSNALRAYGLGQHLERFTVHAYGLTISIAGAVLVLAAIAISLAQARAAWVALSPQRPVRQRILAAIAAALCFAISVTAMASHVLSATRAKVSDEGTARGRYDRAQEAYTKAAAELATLKGVRTSEAIRADMDSAPVDRNVFRRTKECTEITRDTSFTECKPILVLRQEMAQAIRKRALEIETGKLRQTLDALPRPEAMDVAEASVLGHWAWIFGAGVVLIATFGTVICAEAVSVPASQPAPRVEPAPATVTVLPPRDEPGERPVGPPPPPGGGIRALTRDEARRDLIALLAAGHRIPSQEYLGERWGIPGKPMLPGTVSKWLQRFETDGTIPSRSQAGRRKELAAAD